MSDACSCSPVPADLGAAGQQPPLASRAHFWKGCLVSAAQHGALPLASRFLLAAMPERNGHFYIIDMELK